MIAQDFFRVRVLASGNIAAAYGVASMSPHAGIKTSEGAAAPFANGTNVENGTYLIETK